MTQLVGLTKNLWKRKNTAVSRTHQVLNSTNNTLQKRCLHMWRMFCASRTVLMHAIQFWKGRTSFTCANNVSTTLFADGWTIHGGCQEEGTIFTRRAFFWTFGRVWSQPQWRDARLVQCLCKLADIILSHNWQITWFSSYSDHQRIATAFSIVYKCEVIN